MIANLPALGVGLGFREPFLSELFLHRGEVDFLEVTVEHFLGGSLEKQSELELLARNFSLIPHGLNLSLGSADGLDPVYLDAFAQVVCQVQPPWWSEHIAFTRAGGVQIGHLAPLPFSREAIGVLARNIRQAQTAIPFPLILENITFHWKRPGAELSEGEFMRALMEETGCGLLLDVTNLHINAANHGYDPRHFLDALPVESVVQLHFVGVEEHCGALVDSHSKPTSPAIWELLEEVLLRVPVKGAILERDEAIPPLTDLIPELQIARALGRKYKRWA